MTTNGSKNFSVYHRGTAAAVLLCWLFAVSLCAAHCSGLLNEAGKPSCHSTGGHSSHNRTGGGAPGATQICLTFKSAVVKEALDSVPQNASLLLYILPLLALVVALSRLGRNTLCTFIRQVSPAKWLFTPELYLGLSARSLAPPRLS